MDKHGDATPHPAWYTADTPFHHPRYAFALRVGRQAGTVSGNDWQRVEAALHEVWVVLHGGLTWEEARPAVYHGWLQSKRAGA